MVCSGVLASKDGDRDKLEIVTNYADFEKLHDCPPAVIPSQEVNTLFESSIDLEGLCLGHSFLSVKVNTHENHGRVHLLLQTVLERLDAGGVDLAGTPSLRSVVKGFDRHMECSHRLVAAFYSLRAGCHEEVVLVPVVELRGDFVVKVFCSYRKGRVLWKSELFKTNLVVESTSRLDDKIIFMAETK